jgi:dipeptidyl aminopeptidase/acylaminoacyl peptidase
MYTILARGGGGGWQEIHRLTGGSLSLQGLTGDGESVVALGSDGSGRAQLWAIALDGSGARVLAGDAERDVVSVQLDPYSRQPIGAWLGGAEPEVRWFDEAAGKRFNQVARAFPDRSVELYGRSADGARMLARVGGPSAAPVYYLVDFGARKADIVGEAYPALVDVPLGTMRATSYAARDGTRIPAYLTLPPGADGKGLPMVVMPHGGPEAHDEFDFDWFAQYLATRGYAVLQPQFRGSTGFGDAHRRAGYGEWGGLMQDDVTDGVLAMVEQGVADAARVCIVGASYGGYAALAGAALTPDLYACAVSINGISDLPSLVGNLKSSRGEESDAYAYWRKNIGSMHDAKLAERSPARLAERVEAPVLLLHGADDTVVPPRQSRAMAKALATAGKTHTLIELPGEDHWLSRSATRIRVLEETGRFVDTYLRK